MLIGMLKHYQMSTEIGEVQTIKELTIRHYHLEQRKRFADIL